MILSYEEEILSMAWKGMDRPVLSFVYGLDLQHSLLIIRPRVRFQPVENDEETSN
jgi:hypothetical protein